MIGWETLLANHLIAIALAIAGLIAGRLGRPALAHGLLLLALLKLVTPSIVPIEIASTPAPVVAPAAAPTAAVAAAPPVDRHVEPVAEPAAPVDPVAVLWLLGSVLVLSLVAVRGVRFRRAVRRARHAPDALLDEVRGLLSRVGLRRLPRVDVVDARIPPLVFPTLRGARLLLPRRLMSSLSRDQRATLIVHELAHIRRLDPWVRPIEIGVLAAMWWSPVAWWLRSHLRDAEERCCDAWVTGVLPGSRRSYCDALLAVIDSLAERVPIPLAASGAAPAHTYRQRLEQIMLRQHAHRLGWPTRLAVVLIGAAALTTLPTVGQDPPKTIESDDRTLAKQLDRKLRFTTERASLSAWTRGLQTITDVPIVATPAAKELPPRQTRLEEFALPIMSVRRVFDIIADQTGLSWSAEHGVVKFDLGTEPEDRAEPITVRVIGAVKSAGRRASNTETTLFELLSELDLSDRADLHRILIARGDGPDALLMTIDFRMMVLTGNMTYNIFLHDGDTIIVQPRLTPPAYAKPGLRLHFEIDPAIIETPGCALLGELRTDQTVNALGEIVVPLVGRLQITGLTEKELELLVRSELAQRLTIPVTEVYARFRQ